MYAFSIGMALGGVAGLGWLTIFAHDQNGARWIIPLALLLIAAGIYVFRDTRVSKVIIGPDAIRVEGVFTRKELLFSQIKGFRVEERFINIYPVSADLKKIQVFSSLEKYSDILEWLYAHYTNLDEQETTATLEAMLEDTRYGNSPEERAALLKKAVLTSRVLNILAIVISVILLFYGGPLRAYTLIATVAIPWIGMGLIYYYKGLITPGTQKDSPLPSIELAFLAPGFSLCMLSLLTVSLLDHKYVWIPVAAISLLIGLVLWLVAKQRPITFSSAIIARTLGTYVAAAPMYGYGAVVSLNCYFDHSTPLYYEVPVTGKKISSGKGKTYYLKLAPWGPVKDTANVQVPKAFYDRTPENSTVAVYQQTGLFDIPWYEVGDVRQR